MEVYKDKGSAGTAGEILFNQSVYGKDGGNAKQEYTRITHSIRDITALTEDGSIELACVRQGNMETFIQFQGFENEVNFQKPIDMVGNNIRSSTGSMTLTTAASTGLGNIVATAKAGISLTAQNGAFLSTATLGNYDILASSGSISLTANGGGNISISNGGGTFAQTAATSTYTSSISSNFNAPFEYHQGKVVTAFPEQVYQSTYQPFIISTPTSFPSIAQFQREGQMTMLVNSLGDGGNELNIVATPDFTVSCMAFPLVGGGVIVGGTNNFTGLGEVRRGATLADVTSNTGTFLRINFPIPNQIVNCLFINDSLFPNRVAIGGRWLATTSDFYTGTTPFPSWTSQILLADTTAGALTPLDMMDTSIFQTFGLDDEVLTINAQDTAFCPPTVDAGPCYILGGLFSNAINTAGGSLPANHTVFMAANPQTGFQFTSELFLERSGGADDDVRSIQVLNDKIVFGGAFTQIYGSPTPFLAYTDTALGFGCSMLGPASNFQPAGGASIYVGREAYNTAGSQYFSYVGSTDTGAATNPYDLYKIDMTNPAGADPTIEKSFPANISGIGVNNVGGVGTLSFCCGFKFSTGADAYVWDFITPQFIDVNGYTLPWNINHETAITNHFYVFKDPNYTSSLPREMAYIAELAAGPVVISTDATTLPFVNFATPTLKFNTLTLSNRNNFAMGTLCGYGTDDIRMLFYATNGASFSNVP